MTYGVKVLTGVLTGVKRESFSGTVKPWFGESWKEVELGRGWTLDDVWTYAIGCHMGHATEFLVALTCWFVLFADGQWLTDCKEWRIEWVAKVVGFNLTCEVLFCGFWHWLMYVSSLTKHMQPFKFNPENQYQEKEGVRTGMISSSTGHLQREVTFTTLGWLQSAGWQALMMKLWASNALPCYTQFWAHPFFSLCTLGAVTWWREIHFYWCHRGIHPWWDRRNGLAQGDIGAFLYRHAHSLHHKSYNPGPWSGLSMHPVEHFFYYSCAWLLPLVAAIHPLIFLYAKFHADIAPIGGHDGHAEPGPNGDFHWLHHAKFECNYGVPFPIDFDKMFGTWVDYKEYRANGNKMPKQMTDNINKRCGSKKDA